MAIESIEYGVLHARRYNRGRFGGGIDLFDGFHYIVQFALLYGIRTTVNFNLDRIWLRLTFQLLLCCQICIIYVIANQ